MVFKLTDGCPPLEFNSITEFLDTIAEWAQTYEEGGEAEFCVRVFNHL